MRLKIIIAYDGTGYSGWQIQEKPLPPPTIQGAVEMALFSLCGTRVRVFGSGRTDAGVHAHGQVAHFDMEERPSLLRMDWRKSLNAKLPPDIRIIEAKTAQDNFHARKDALLKTYVYQFWLDPAFMPPSLRNFAWACGPLDLERMKEAMPAFLGKHDFASFRNAGTDTESTVREIVKMELERFPAPDFYPGGMALARLSITATGFLKQMARNLAGCLAHVGAGKLAASDCAKILALKDRRALPSPTAPARGLALARVQYPK